MKKSDGKREPKSEVLKARRDALRTSLKGIQREIENRYRRLYIIRRWLTVGGIEYKNYCSAVGCGLKAKAEIWKLKQIRKDLFCIYEGV